MQSGQFYSRGKIPGKTLFVALFFILFTVYLLTDTFDFVHFYTYLFRVKGLFKFSASLFLYTGLVFSTTLLVTSRHLFLKILSFVLLIFTLTMEASYLIINGYGFTFTEASISLKETAFIMDAITTFFPKVWFVLPSVLIFAFLLFWISHYYLPKVSWKLSVPVSLFFLSLAYFVLKGTGGQQTYPTMFKIPILMVYAVNNPVYMGPRDIVPVSPVRLPAYRHIIYLVDESVRGDFITLNNAREPVAPFLVSVSGRICNYGIMSAGGNFSANSQLILRSGVKSDFFPDTAQRSLRIPDILQYAKKAGYYTIYLDGQKNVLQNYMKEPDTKYIDFYKGIPEHYEKRDSIDFKLADELVKLMADTARMTFTYFVKMGAHFHYERYYPPEQRIYTPAMKLGELNNDREKMVNSFRNVVHWNVDHFFYYLLNKLGSRKDYIILYTSDHGQTLLDHGILSTHADVRHAHPFQAMVPFFIVFPDSLQKKNFRYVSENYNHLTHFNIFPGILTLMGYDSGWIRQHYDPSFFDTVKTTRIFYSGMLFNKGLGYRNIFDTPEMIKVQQELKRAGR
ncbi:MAG: sulfatase-like hydrolase/transferase [Syntrophothermus sp.]